MLLDPAVPPLELGEELEPDAPGEELLEPELGEALDEPLDDWSEELGVELLELEELGEELLLGGVALEPELELELGELGELELGEELEPELDMEPEGEELGEVLEPDDDEEPEGDEAPLLESPGRLHPYRLVTATAIGRTTRAVFLIKLICGLLSDGLLKPFLRCKERARSRLVENRRPRRHP